MQENKDQVLEKEDDFEYPNLFVEVSEMTIASVLVFFFASVRRLAREKQLDEKLLELPITGNRCLEIVTPEIERVKGNIKSNEFDTVLNIYEEYLAGQTEHIEKTTLHYFGDDEANECVYSLSVNEHRKRISLVFRGTTTISDWLTDAQMVCSEWEHPRDSSSMLGVHLGFRNMLLDDTIPIVKPPHESIQSLKDKFTDRVPMLGKKFSESSKDESGRLKNNMDQILSEAEKLLKQFPGFRLYITGHSLGGALSSLVALAAATRFATKDRPVTCIPIANPKSGDQTFADAIYELETAGKLRCLVVHNHLDVVPRKPTKLFHCRLCQHTEFRQIGFQLILRPKEIKIQHTHGTKEETIWSEIKRTFQFPNVPAQHNYREYWKRLLSNEKHLSDMKLNDLYRDMGIDFQ